MKKTVCLVLICQLLSCFIFSSISDTANDSNIYDFKQFNWYDSVEKIKEIEGEPSDEGDSQAGHTLYYDVNAIGLDAFLGYSFNKNGLCDVMYVFTEKHSSASSYIYDFNTIKEALDKKYGEPIICRELWDTSEHESYYSDNKGQALEYGYLKLVAKYELERTSIMLITSSVNYEIGTSLSYVSKVNPVEEIDYSNDI